MPRTRTTAKPKAKPIKRKQTPSTKKPTAKDAAAAIKPRRLHVPVSRPFRFSRVKHPVRLPSSWGLFRQAIGLIWRNKRVFLGLALMYGILNMVLVRGLSGGTDVNTLKQQTAASLGGNPGQLATDFSVFVSLLGSTGNDANPTAGPYQFFVLLVVSLATIWATRQVLAGHMIRIRDAFYKGIYPLVPFVLVLVVVLLQAIPLLVGGLIYVIVISTGIAVTGIEQLLWGLLSLTIAFTTVYMLCSSLFALYIVTLPDMTPWRALRSARQVVRYRRGQILRKLLFLPVALLVINGAIMLPLIWFLPVVAQWIFFVLSMLTLVVVHVYMYTLYKALLV
jgi:hypothetical protein